LDEKRIAGRLGGAAIGVSAGAVAFWGGVLLLLWRSDRRH
jgi:hypothetical protein